MPKIDNADDTNERSSRTTPSGFEFVRDPFRSLEIVGTKGRVRGSAVEVDSSGAGRGETVPGETGRGETDIKRGAVGETRLARTGDAAGDAALPAPSDRRRGG